MTTEMFQEYAKHLQRKISILVGALCTLCALLTVVIILLLIAYGFTGSERHDSESTTQAVRYASYTTAITTSTPITETETETDTETETENKNENKNKDSNAQEHYLFTVLDKYSQNITVIVCVVVGSIAICRATSRVCRAFERASRRKD